MLIGKIPYKKVRELAIESFDLEFFMEETGELSIPSSPEYVEYVDLSAAFRWELQGSGTASDNHRFWAAVDTDDVNASRFRPELFEQEGLVAEVKPTLEDVQKSMVNFFDLCKARHGYGSAVDKADYFAKKYHFRSSFELKGLDPDLYAPMFRELKYRTRGARFKESNRDRRLREARTRVGAREFETCVGATSGASASLTPRPPMPQPKPLQLDPNSEMFRRDEQTVVVGKSAVLSDIPPGKVFMVDESTGLPVQSPGKITIVGLDMAASTEPSEETKAITRALQKNTTSHEHIAPWLKDPK